MQVPLEIIWHEMDPLPHVDERVRERVARLEKFFDRIIGIHVVIEAAHRRPKGPSADYEVRLEVTVPGSVLTIDRKPGDVHTHKDPQMAVRDAFQAMERKLKRWKEEHSGRPEVTETPYLQGKIAELNPPEGGGQIAVTDGRLIYFHRNAVISGDYEALNVGDPVELMIAPEDDAVNLHASSVRPIGAREFVDEPR